jgi:hypothetical protein
MTTAQMATFINEAMSEEVLQFLMKPEMTTAQMATFINEAMSEEISQFLMKAGDDSRSNGYVY